MSIHTKHSSGNCEVCAAQVEADEVGATPPAGHRLRPIDELANELAFAIYYGDRAALVSQSSIRNLLIEFAEEIKRQAVEP